MKITEITDNAFIKIRGLVNAFHHNHDIDFIETEPNVFVYDKDFYSLKIYGSTSVKVSIHTIGDKRDKLFTAKQPLQCVREVISEIENIEQNIELLFELFKRVGTLKNFTVTVDKKKGIFIFGPNKLKLKILLWLTSLGPRLICEFPAVLWKRDTEQIFHKSLDAFIDAIVEASKTTDFNDRSAILRDYYPRSIDDD